MRAIDKMKLIGQIALKLQEQMTYAQIDSYFTALGLDCSNFQGSTNSKRVYAEEFLSDKDEDIIFKIADELEVSHEFTTVSSNFNEEVSDNPSFWKEGYFRLFLSHLASFKVTTAHLKGALEKYGISAFVAHDDIEPSKEWQNEIESGLRTMDGFCPLLMDGFKESNWCDQEIGFAVARNVLIIPVRKKLDPYGFIMKYQGIQGEGKNIDQVAYLIFDTIAKSPKTKHKMMNILCTLISTSTDVSEASNRLDILMKVDEIPRDILEKFGEAISNNSVLMDDMKFVPRVNNLLSKNELPAISKSTNVSSSQWDDLPF